MDNVFLEMVDDTLKENGVDTTDMTDEQKIAKFQELAGKAPDVAEEVVEKVAEEAQAGGTDEEDPDAELPGQQPVSPTKL